MTAVNFVEDAPIVGGLRLTSDGYAPCSARVGRTGIQTYRGAELGHPEVETIDVYRPEAEVFSPDSMASLAYRPVTLGHPAEPVAAANWREHAVGSVDGAVARDKDFIKVDMLLMDAAAIQAVQKGTRELSLGYTAELVMEDGISPEGEPYTARMANLKHNHVALVARGRAGPECRVQTGDAATPSTTWGASPIADGSPSPRADEASATSTTINRGPTMQTIKRVVDGITIDTTEAGAEAIAKLEGKLQAADAAVAEAKATSDATVEAAKATADAELAERDKVLAAKDAEIDALKAKVLTDDALDARVAERAAVLSKAKALTKDADFAGKSDREIKHATVTAVRGADALVGKSDAYVDAAFDLIDVPKGTGDGVRDALINRDAAVPTAADHGQSDYQRRISDAWKNTTEAA